VQLVPDTLPWANDQARDCYMEFLQIIEQQADEHSESAVYLARCGEMAVRLATIRAAGRWGRGASVDLSDMEWGTGLAYLAGLDMATLAQDFLPRNERGNMADKIANYIYRKGPVKPRDIQQFLKGRLRSSEIKDIVGQLVEAGEVEWTGQGYQRVPALEKPASVERATHAALTDPWGSRVREWLGARDDVSIWEVLAGAFGIAIQTATQADQNRVVAILDDLGFVQFRPRHDGSRQRRYRKGA
jgi:hypothetical protein